MVGVPMVLVLLKVLPDSSPHVLEQREKSGIDKSVCLEGYIEFLNLKTIGGFIV